MQGAAAQPATHGKPESRFLEIDVLRGLAALTVVFSHFFPFWNRYAAPIPVLVPNVAGYWAVKLFFVISGFVIFFTLERCRTVLDFVALRFSRLYPAYWASLAAVTAVSVLLVGNSFWLGGFAANITMFQQFFGFPHFDNVYWSLSVELAFYVNVAILFGLGVLRRPHWVLAAWLALAAVWAIGFHDFGNVTAAARELVATDQRDWPALLFAFDYSPYFVAGIVFYLAATQAWTPRLAVLLVFALAVECVLAGFEGAVVYLACIALFGLAVSGRLRFLVGSATLWLGAISYSLYLVHRNLGFFLLAWLRDLGINAFVAIGFAAALCLLIATAFAFAIEHPASRRIRSAYRSAIGAPR